MLHKNIFTPPTNLQNLPIFTLLKLSKLVIFASFDNLFRILPSWKIDKMMEETETKNH